MNHHLIHEIWKIITIQSKGKQKEKAIKRKAEVNEFENNKDINLGSAFSVKGVNNIPP